MRISGMILILLFCTSVISTAQTLKELDYSNHYKLSEVHTQKVVMEHEGGPECLEFVRKYDSEGRIVEEIRYFACGRKHSVQKFSYNEQGVLARNTFAQVFMQFNEIEFDLTFNANGQLIERSLDKPVPQGWQKETLTYHSDGSVKSCIQWNQTDGKWIVFTEQHFHNKAADHASRKKNTLTRVFDMKGLPLVHYRYSEDGTIKSALRYSHFTNDELGEK